MTSFSIGIAGGVPEGFVDPGSKEDVGGAEKIEVAGESGNEAVGAGVAVEAAVDEAAALAALLRLILGLVGAGVLAKAEVWEPKPKGVDESGGPPNIEAGVTGITAAGVGAARAAGVGAAFGVGAVVVGIGVVVGIRVEIDAVGVLDVMGRFSRALILNSNIWLLFKFLSSSLLMVVFSDLSDEFSDLSDSFSVLSVWLCPVSSACSASQVFSDQLISFKLNLINKELGLDILFSVYIFFSPRTCFWAS